MSDTMYVNDDGAKACLDSTTGKAATPIGGGKLRLFTLPTTVNKTKVIGDMTEASFAGYAAATLNTANWSAAMVAANIASSTYTTPVTFTRSSTGAPQTCYGAYITDSGNTKLYACWLFAAGPVTLTNAGDNIVVTPAVNDQSGN